MYQPGLWGAGDKAVAENPDFGELSQQSFFVGERRRCGLFDLYSLVRSLRPVWMLKTVSAQLPAGKRVRTWPTLGGRGLNPWVWSSSLGGPLGYSVTPQFTWVPVKQVYLATSQGW